ncbi:adenylate kinase 9-like isoform X3 [Gigantopelta aegis]|uniref:adenylate kinase 9-like isoform X3 n=1 Tax=Gigantopelta aegis TaxID=1735272 RepID=UPI001B887E93|nr:adenylate kinase 9-like isoform X3 [Gigantopelta aegis]
MADEEDLTPPAVNMTDEADSTPQAADTAIETNQEPQCDRPTMEAVSVIDPVTAMGDMEELVQNLDVDPYNEDQTELRFLHSKPSCFIVIGKPGVGKTTLARRLAQEWKCQLINSTNLINENLELQTEIGKKCLEVLTKGEAVSEEMVFSMIQEKINSPEVAHHGYVLDDLPCLSEDFMTIKDQIELIRNWKLKPDFIIHLKISDKDLDRRRIGMKIDPFSGNIYVKDVYAPEKRPKPQDDDKDLEEEEEEEEEEAEDEELAADADESSIRLPPEVVERLITRPDDLPEQVEQNIRNYKNNMLRMLEDYMADHDQQYLVEMDSNQMCAVIFKQLMQRLECFVLRPAAVPTRLFEPEEEDVPEDIETDELMRAMAPKQMVAPRFRWRRSRWLRNCPVALFEGNIVGGKPEFVVSFLDKMYFLSSAEAMEKFMKNPRPYLLPPQPRPPCKFSVLGPPLSGKTTLCHLLAQKYGATVLDMDELIKPKQEEEKKRQIEQARAEATESAIVAVKVKIKEQMEAEAEAAAAAREAELAAQEEAEEAALAKEEEGKEKIDSDEESKDGSKEEKSADLEQETGPSETQEDEQAEPAEPTESAHPAERTEMEQSESEKPDDENVQPPEPEVDATHPDVVAIVDAAVKEAEKNITQLPPEVYVDVMEAAIKDAERELRKKNKEEGALNGGYIFDNFPATRDHWNACVEKGVLPDNVIVLQDRSTNSENLTKRYYLLQRDEIDEKIRLRIEKEQESKRREEEEKRLQEEREKQRIEEELRQFAEEERRRKQEEAEEEGEGEDLEATQDGEQPVEGDSSGDQPQEAEPDTEATQGEEAAKADVPEDQSESVSPDRTKSDVPETQQESASPERTSPERTKSEQEEAWVPEETKEIKIPTGPELEEFRQKLSEFDKEFSSIVGTITGSAGIEPIEVDVGEKGIEGVLQDSVIQVEKQFTYTGWEFSGMDLDEEEEDMEADAAEEEEEEEAAEAEEEDPNRSKKKPLGDTNHFCPVALTDDGVLFPGNPEIAARYREKVYYLQSSESRDTFLAAPEKYLPKNKPLDPPPIRLLILGPRGSGKSLHGRHLAKKLGLFHISFKDRLQELIIAKTKKRVGPEYEDENELIPEDHDEDEEEPQSAITAPTSDSAIESDGTARAPDSDTQTDSQGGVTQTESKDEKAEDEDEEDEEPQLTEDEEAIRANLESDEPLPGEVLDNIIPQFWQKESFKSTGFILEGFPRTADEVRYMADSGLFPDAAIIITVSDTDVIGRLLPPKLSRWKIKRDKLMARKQKRKEKAKKKRDTAIQKRREELTREAEERKKEKLAQRQFEKEDEDYDEEEEEAEDEEEDDIEAVLAEEFEEEEDEEEEEEELEEDAIDRIRNELNEVYDNDTNRLEMVQETLEELFIPRLEIDGSRKPHIIRYTMTKKLKRFVEYRPSIFERVYPVSEKVAKRMLQAGYKQPSRFGRWCPVKLSDGECIQPMSGPGHPTYPCVYRGYIYYLSSMECREQFVQNPIAYLKQPSPKPVVPIRLAIIGPPKSGKSTIAKRFADDYGLMRLSIGEAMRTILFNQPSSELARQMNEYLYKGLTVPDELAVKALEVCLLDMRCQRRGFVLDGYPISKRQIELMTERSIIPVRVVELTLDSKEIMVRGTKDRVSPDRVLPLHDSAQILYTKVQAYYQSAKDIYDWYDKEHMNIQKIDASQSKWAVWNAVIALSEDSVKQIQNYLQRISEGKASSIANMCITPKEFCQRLGDFGQYCPVSLALRGELVDCSTSPSLEFAAEFRGHYYKMGGKEELEQFLAEPEKFVPPLAPRHLPPKELLPKRKSPEDIPSMIEIELQGYCPVTFLDGKCRYEAIVPGNPDLIAEYQGKFFYMETEEKLLKFMKLPKEYWNLKLPHKLPPRKEPLPVTGLPMLGYMEQTVAVAIIKALTAAGNFKPKYPFLTTSRSSLIYVAYHLKAFNPKSSDYVRKKYKKKLEKFEETCSLIDYLGNTMTIKYKEEKDRPDDFDTKLEMFFALRGIEPTSTWIA